MCRNPSRYKNNNFLFQLSTLERRDENVYGKCNRAFALSVETSSIEVKVK